MKNMYQNIISKGLSTLLVVFTFLSFSFGQEELEDTTYNDSNIRRLQVYDGFDIPSDFKSQYRTALRRVRKVYPLALEAARVIDSLENELEDIDKNRKQRQLMRQTQRSLKKDFKFLMKDLYISEGKVLTKLIYRETGMTVSEIISKYKNGVEASLYSGMAGFFEQDLNAAYYPETEDFVLECVIRDIESGKVPFDPHFETVTKEEFKAEKKEDKKRRKERKAKRKREESEVRGMSRKKAQE